MPTPKPSKIAIWTSLAILCLSLTGCGTVSPSPVEAHKHRFDASTPDGYDPYNSGLVEYLADEKGNTTGAIITTNAREKWNNLIDAYHLQFKAEYKINLQKDSGISEWTEPGTDFPTDKKLWKIDAKRLQYFMRLSQWSTDKRPNDSLWQKAKAVVGGS